LTHHPPGVDGVVEILDLAQGQMMRVFTDMYQEMQIAISGGVYQSARADPTRKRKGKKLGKKRGKARGGSRGHFCFKYYFFQQNYP